MLFNTRWPIAVALLITITSAASAANGINWYETYDHARDEAQRTGKPIFMAFRCAP